MKKYARLLMFLFALGIMALGSSNAFAYYKCYNYSTSGTPAYFSYSTDADTYVTSPVVVKEYTRVYKYKAQKTSTTPTYTKVNHYYDPYYDPYYYYDPYWDYWWWW